MRVEHTNNNIIDITFDPSTDGICLLDFVLVEEGNEKFLAQVIEIKDDKYDAGLNIATIKIVYKINEKNEIVPYDNFTPTRTCKISVCNQKLIEDFINEGNETFEFSVNPKTMLPLKLDKDFFTNKPVILADKMDDFNLLSANLSHILSDYKNVVIFDYTGSLDIEDSARLRASIDFRLPLDYETMDVIWEQCMKDATIEVQAACEDIFNEVKSYLKTLRGKSIPYNLFLKTIIDEYNKERSVELWYLKNKLIKFFDAQLFAQSVEDIEPLSSTIADNKTTIIDFSNIDISWHKAFCEFILRTVRQDVYLFLRLNDSTSNMDIVNTMYGKNKINVIPSVSYGYKKLPSIAENFNNYIFLSTLNPIRNYGVLNPSIWSLDSNYALLYGENTKELIFKVQNTVSIDDEIKERKKVKTIQIEDFKKQEEDEEQKEQEEQHVEEEQQQEETVQAEEETPVKDVEPKIIVPEEIVHETPNRIVVEKPEFTEEGQGQEENFEEIPEEFLGEDFDIAELQKQLNEETLKEELFSSPSEEYDEEDEIQSVDDVETLEETPNAQDEAPNVQEEIPESGEEVVQEYPQEELQMNENGEMEFVEDVKPDIQNEENLEEEFQNLFEEPAEQEIEEPAQVVEESSDQTAEPIAAETPIEQEVEEPTGQTVEEFLEQTPEENQEESDVDFFESLSDTELDLYENIKAEEESESEIPLNEGFEEVQEQAEIVSDEISDEDIVEIKEENIEVESKPNEEAQEENEEFYDEQLRAFLDDDEPKEEENPKYDVIDIDFSPVQEEENNVEDTYVVQKPKEIPVSEENNVEDTYVVQKPNEAPVQEQNTGIENVQVVEEPQSAPVQEPVEEFIPETVASETTVKTSFKEGEVVTHQKYGIGKVLEVIEYSNRTLLQIEFADIGKRLLDPDIAKIKPLS